MSKLNYSSSLPSNRPSSSLFSLVVEILVRSVPGRRRRHGSDGEISQGEFRRSGQKLLPRGSQAMEIGRYNCQESETKVSDDCGSRKAFRSPTQEEENPGPSSPSLPFIHSFRIRIFYFSGAHILLTETVDLTLLARSMKRIDDLCYSEIFILHGIRLEL